MSPSKHQIAVIDVQGFHGINNNFIAKEISICFNLTCHQQFLIKPPFNFALLSKKQQKQALWLTKNHHGIDWDAGQLSLLDVKKYLRFNLKNYKVFVKGKQKVSWLKNNFDINATALRDEDCPYSLKDLLERYRVQIQCSAHGDESFVCALRNSIAIRHFIANDAVFLEN